MSVDDEQFIGMGVCARQDRQQIGGFVARGDNDGDLFATRATLGDAGRAWWTAIPLGQIDSHKTPYVNLS
jgi:hypothetical protein